MSASAVAPLIFRKLIRMTYRLYPNSSNHLEDNAAPEEGQACGHQYRVVANRLEFPFLAGNTTTNLLEAVSTTKKA